MCADRARVPSDFGHLLGCRVTATGIVGTANATQTVGTPSSCGCVAILSRPNETQTVWRLGGAHGSARSATESRKSGSARNHIQLCPRPPRTGAPRLHQTRPGPEATNGRCAYTNKHNKRRPRCLISIPGRHTRFQRPHGHQQGRVLGPDLPPRQARPRQLHAVDLGARADRRDPELERPDAQVHGCSLSRTGCGSGAVSGTALLTAAGEPDAPPSASARCERIRGTSASVIST